MANNCRSIETVRYSLFGELGMFREKMLKSQSKCQKKA